MSSIRDLGRAARGLVAGSPHEKLATLEKITERILWRLPLVEIEEHLQSAPVLDDSALQNAKLYADRTRMLSASPKGGTVAEVGVFRGQFSREILRVCKPDEFHLIDLDFGPLADDIEGVRHEGDSSTVLNHFGPSVFDWIYIDGDHSYEGVRKDLAAVDRALKFGGYLMCNDYTNWNSATVSPYGVARAVNQFVIERRYSVAGLALHPCGMFDLLVRKPKSRHPAA